MMWLHFLQRILNTLPRTLSSAIEYLVAQLSQTIFIVALATPPIGKAKRQFSIEGGLGKGKPNESLAFFSNHEAPGRASPRQTRKGSPQRRGAAFGTSAEGIAQHDGLGSTRAHADQDSGDAD